MRLFSLDEARDLHGTPVPPRKIAAIGGWYAEGLQSFFADFFVSLSSAHAQR